MDTKLSSEKRKTVSDDTQPKKLPRMETTEEMKEIRRKRLQAWRQSQNIQPKEPPVEETVTNEQILVEKPQEEKEPLPEETAKKQNPQDEDEIDPLDAFMSELHKQQRNSNIVKRSDGLVSKAEKTVRQKWSKDKGQLMENNDNDYVEEELEDIEEALRRFKPKKEKVVQIDHTKIHYEEFRKCFYRPVPEITAMSKDQVILYRKKLDDIKVKGKSVPRPVKNWAQTGLPLKILDGLKRLDFHTPTPIQSQAIVTILSGHDVIGIAKTGSGKTLAFGLPMIRHVADQRPLEPGEGPIGLVMTPTRELCIQVTRDIRKFAKYFGLTVVSIYGGTCISDQIALLKRGCEIVVCTPGRMIDLLAANNGKVTNLKRVTFIAIDEADRMFDLGFEPQVMRIVDNSRPDKQTVLFSATFPRSMEALARHTLKSTVEIQIGGRNVVCSDVEQHVILLEQNQKFLKLLELLGLYGERGSTLVFVDTQEHADDLLKGLLKQGYPCMALHGGVDQYDRDSIFRDFKTGDIRLLVSTSLAARGLDVRDLLLVINYDCPNHYEDYVHRCGRTGRAGNKGHAFTFVTPDQERSSVELIEALRLSNTPIPEDLAAMGEAYMLRISEQGKKVNRKNGFGGRGYKFTESESVSHANEQRAMFGHDSEFVETGDFYENTAEIEGKIEQLLKGESSNMSSLMVSARKEANRFKIEKAMQLNYSENPQDLIDLRSRAEQMAEMIHDKVGYTPSPSIYSDEASKYVRYDTVLEINDFPKQVRVKVTSPEVINQIEDYCGGSITVRGVFVERGKRVPDNEKKLYLSIAGTSRMSLDRASREIVRIIKEEMVEMEGSARYQQPGRYIV